MFMATRIETNFNVIPSIRSKQKFKMTNLKVKR